MTTRRNLFMMAGGAALASALPAAASPRFSKIEWTRGMAIQNAADPLVKLGIAEARSKGSIHLAMYADTTPLRAALEKMSNAIDIYYSTGDQVVFLEHASEAFEHAGMVEDGGSYYFPEEETLSNAPEVEILAWELVAERNTEKLERHAVPGGWLYRNTFATSDSLAMSFVPNVPDNDTMARIVHGVEESNARPDPVN